MGQQLPAVLRGWLGAAHWRPLVPIEAVCQQEKLTGGPMVYAGAAGRSLGRLAIGRKIGRGFITAAGFAISIGHARLVAVLTTYVSIGASRAKDAFACGALRAIVQHRWV